MDDAVDAELVVADGVLESDGGVSSVVDVEGEGEVEADSCSDGGGDCCGGKVGMSMYREVIPVHMITIKVQ